MQPAAFATDNHRTFAIYSMQCDLSHYPSLNQSMSGMRTPNWGCRGKNQGSCTLIRASALATCCVSFPTVLRRACCPSPHSQGHTSAFHWFVASPPKHTACTRLSTVPCRGPHSCKAKCHCHALDHSHMAVEPRIRMPFIGKGSFVPVWRPLDCKMASYYNYLPCLGPSRRGRQASLAPCKLQASVSGSRSSA